MKNFLQKNRTALTTTAIIIAFLFIWSITTLILDIIYADKFYPGVKIAGVNISSLTPDQAEKIFKAKFEEFNQHGQNFIWNKQTLKVYPTIFSTTDPDLSYDLVSFKLDQTLDQAYTFGRGQNFLDSAWQKIKLIFINKNLTLLFEINQNEIKKILTNNFSEYEDLGNNPQIEFELNAIQITQGKNGLVFNYSSLINQFKNNLAHLNFKPIALELILSQPKFNKEQAAFLKPNIQAAMNLAPLQVKGTTTSGYLFTDKILLTDFKNWLMLDYDSITRRPILKINPGHVQEYLTTIQHYFYQPVREPKFNLQNGRVVEFQGAQVGKEIDIDLTLKNIQENILDQQQKTFFIQTQDTQPNQATSELNNLGIAEKIGTGGSNFSGSPVNRRHNIKVGAESINGLILAPGEEFSTNAALGEINAAKGYLPELVIKGNETVPEYGGGLCQVATTLFRLAINSGLPITARKSHAYRVSYYEPAGTDATIYSPWPDFRFKNDTQHSLLLQTKVVGDNLTFEFWGTSDGRQVATTSPEIYNITSPGPVKNIETTELAPGKKRCVETAHYGADAHFKRTITYPQAEKETSEEIFESHYRPWQAVCLIGVDPNKISTSTDEVVE